MPNHCENDLWIMGPVEDVAALLALVGADRPEPAFDFNALIPCIEHWGTKWNAYKVMRRDYGGRVCITFQTAWSPPAPVIAELAKRFPSCSLEHAYFESGMPFCGGTLYDDGERSEWECEDYRGVRGG